MWEYTCLYVHTSDHSLPPPDDLVGALDEYGREQWELISSNGRTDPLVLIFKRPHTPEACDES